MKTPLLLYSQTASSLFIPCLSAFKTTLNSSTLGAYINKCLSLNGNQLKVADRLYLLNKNVHLVAIGKAAPVMVESAEKILGQHFVDGIASVPTGSNIPNNLKTQFLFGAENNLPDEQALENTKQIENFVKFIGQPNQLILFLISGGGSALLPAPINGISLANKLEIIKLLQNYGADIKQLNVVRQALSRLKGGGLSRLASPAQQIALIVSDIIGDPIELISSGPTVILNKSSQKPMEIINKLGIKREQIGQKIIKVLEQREEKVKEKEVDILNIIVANNSMILKELSAHLNSAGFIPIIVTNCLEGNATKLGQSMARILVKLATQAKHLLALDISNFLKEEFSVNLDISNINISKNDKIVLIFGGESTVCFDSSQVLPEAKGGRNQEMVLSVLNELLLLGEEEKKKQILNGLEFVFTSLGTDGQDGPTDAAGAFICSEDLLNKSTEQLSSLSTKVKSALKEKRSYQFWSEFNEGRNIVKMGKTGMNVMDIQMLIFKF
uniref:Glycerate kinase n=2 Tax=Meloidogyne incognita TaxID=6306 RepID=A0A914L6N1_MELIC